MCIPNDSIQTCIKDEKDMATTKIRVFLVDIMLEIGLDVYETYVIMYCKGVKKPLFHCQNVTYGTMKEILLYYKKFRNSIEDERYEFNSYETCVSNNIIKVIQMTVCFHEYNCKLTHKSPKLVGKLITCLK